MVVREENDLQERHEDMKAMYEGFTLTYSIVLVLDYLYRSM